MSKQSRTDISLGSLLARDIDIVLRSEQDALDILSSDLPACLFTLDDLHPDFFDLKNGLAGNIFQKFTNYCYQAAFVIPEDHNLGIRAEELIREYKSHPYIRFFPSNEDAYAWLSPDNI